jgi:hypothetical protein
VAETSVPTPARVGRSRMGDRVGGFIYGTIVALSVIVAGSRAFPHEAGHIAALVAVTCVVFWMTHVYAHGLGHSVATEAHLTLGELAHIARREGSVVEAAVPPVIVLLLGAVGILSTNVAVWVAFGTGLAVLVAQGLIFARVERLGLLGTLAVTSANLGLGLLLAALKLFLMH